MANISISLHLNAYKGFKYMYEKDQAGNKVYYAAIPVKELFNPSGTTNIYATSVMIPTPNSKYSDFMLKPMLSAQELQSMTQEQFRELPVYGTGKYMQQQVSKDLMKEATKSATVDEEDMSFLSGMPESSGQPQAPQNFAQQAAPAAPSFAPAPIQMPYATPDTPNTLYYITDNNQVLVTAKIWTDAHQLFSAQPSPTCMLHKYEGNVVLGTWTKEQLAKVGL